MINQQMLDYIKQQIQQGVSQEQIKNSLMANGWQQQDIEEGFNNIVAQGAPSSFSAVPVAASSGNRKIIAGIVIGVAVLGGGAYLASQTIFKSKEAPKISNEVSNQSSVNTVTQQSNRDQQQTNTQNSAPITKPDLKPESQITKLDCGTILSENLLAKPENRTASEKNSLECFAKATFDCQASSLKVTGTDPGEFEVIKKEGANCVIKSKASAGAKQCAVPMNAITDLKTYAETENLFLGDVIAPLSFMIAFEQGTNNQTGQTIKLTCTNL